MLLSTARIDHASRHLIEKGVISGSPNSANTRDAFKEVARQVLGNPHKTFDNVLRGNLSVKGYYSHINGRDVVIYIAKTKQGNRIQNGDIVTAMELTPQQMINFGL